MFSQRVWKCQVIAVLLVAVSILIVVQGFGTPRGPYLSEEGIGGDSDAAGGAADDHQPVSAVETSVRPPRMGGNGAAGRPLVASTSSSRLSRNARHCSPLLLLEDTPPKKEALS